MPISLRELQEAQRPLQDRVLEFLRKSPGLAYTVLEILSGMEVNMKNAALALAFIPSEERQKLLARYTEALVTLQERGLVRRWPHKGLDYFSLNPVLPPLQKPPRLAPR